MSIRARFRVALRIVGCRKKCRTPSLERWWTTATGSSPDWRAAECPPFTSQRTSGSSATLHSRSFIRTSSNDGNFLDRLGREAKAAAKLSHPHVVGVLDQGSDGPTAYLVMEYIKGHTLRDVIKEKGALSPRLALALIDPVVEGLGSAHAAGLIHRDIKPENVLIADDGRIKLGDFGLARAVTTSTSTGALIGTVAYLSPELVLGRTADARSDIYSVGIMLYEMITGKQPFDGEVPIQVAYQHVNSSRGSPFGRGAGAGRRSGRARAVVHGKGPRAAPGGRQRAPVGAKAHPHQPHRRGTGSSAPGGDRRRRPFTGRAAPACTPAYRAAAPCTSGPNRGPVRRTASNRNHLAPEQSHHGTLGFAAASGPVRCTGGPGGAGSRLRGCRRTTRTPRPR